MYKFMTVALLLVSLSSLQAQSPAKAQPPGAARIVSTDNRPIQRQWKGVFTFPDGAVSFSNNFPGARLNGVGKVNDSLYSLLITSENTPVNASPWYAFKVWSKTSRTILLQLTYQQGVNHRYTPWLSNNGRDWALLDPSAIKQGRDSIPADCVFRIPVSRDTTWVAARKLITAADVQRWVAQLSRKTGAPATVIGRSPGGKPIQALKLGNVRSAHRILLMGRQYSPEVTGQLAQTAFVERILESDSLANLFRQRFMVYLLPMMNPDGVEEGTWRHSAGGVDLNRDWYAVNQPETKAAQVYLQRSWRIPTTSCCSRSTSIPPMKRSFLS